jgi:hypothetical protein
MANDMKLFGDASAPLATMRGSQDRQVVALLERDVTELSALRPADALRRALRLIASDQDWSVGHVYLRRDGDPPAVATGMMYESDAIEELALHDAARELRTTVGPRLAASVMRSREPFKSFHSFYDSS